MRARAYAHAGQKCCNTEQKKKLCYYNGSNSMIDRERESERERERERERETERQRQRDRDRETERMMDEWRYTVQDW